MKATEADSNEPSKLHTLLRKSTGHISSKFHDKSPKGRKQSQPHKITEAAATPTSVLTSSGSVNELSGNVPKEDSVEARMAGTQAGQESLNRRQSTGHHSRSKKLHQVSSPILSSSSDIFERSAGGTISPLSLLTNFNVEKRNGRSYSIASNASALSSVNGYIPSHHNIEDYIAPILDSTTEIVADPRVDMKDVELVCCESEDDYDNDVNETDGRFATTSYFDTPEKGHNLPLRSRLRSRSVIGASLLHSLNTEQLPASQNHASSTSPPRLSKSSRSSTSLYTRPSCCVTHSDLKPKSKTINFYCFADVCNKEHLSGSSSLSLSPKRPSFIDDELINEDQILKLNNYSIEQAQLAETSLGFTSISMKDYISSLK